MKKFGRLTVMLSMLLTVTLSLSACGGNTATPAPTNTTGTGNTSTGTTPTMAMAVTPSAGMMAMTPTAGNVITGTGTMTGTSGMTPAPTVQVDTAKLGDKKLFIYNWGDYIDQDLVKKFSEQYGIQVQQDSYGSNEEMIAKLVAGGGGYDLVVPSDYAVAQMAKKGLLEKIDFSNIPNYKNIGKEFLNTYFDPTNEYSVPYFWGTTGIAYDSAHITTPPDSWAVMFDPQYKGEIAMLDDEREVPGAVLKLLGYSLNTTDTKQLAEAQQKLIEQKPLVKAYDATNLDNMKKGEVWLAQMYVGDAQRAAEERDTIKYVIPKEGATLWQDNLSIPKGAPHKYTAELFINFMLDAQNGATNANTIVYPSPNTAARQFINPDNLSNPTLYPPTDVMGKLERIVDLGDDTQLYTRMYEEVKNH